MIIVIPKGTSAKKVRKLIDTKKSSSKKLEDFFGKLPNIEDGIKFQKRTRK